MIIENIHIVNFGKLSDFHLDLTEGVNIIEGKNESGKSTVCAFIKFVLYGLPAKAEERERAISWKSGNCAGSLTLREGERTYRIEREAVAVKNSEGKLSYRERTAVYDGETGKQAFKSSTPGEVFFGIPRTVFESTAFVGQLEGSKVGGKTLSEAAENILFSADESVNTKKAVKKLDEARVYLYHKNKRGGKIYDYINERTILAESLDEAQRNSAQIINLEGSARAISEAKAAAKQRLAAVTEELALFERYGIKKNCLKLLEEKKKSETAAQKLHELMTHDRYGESNMTDERFIELMESEKFELASLERDFENSREAIDSITKKLDKMNAKLNNFQHLGENETRDELIESAQSARKSKDLFIKICALLGALGTALAICAFALPLLAVFGAICLVGAVALLGICARKGKTEAGIYRRFGCSTRAEFEELLAAAQNDKVAISLIEESKAEALRKREYAEEKLETHKARICAILAGAQFQISGNIRKDMEEAVSLAKASLENMRSIAQEKSAADAKMQEIAAVLSTYPDEEKERAITESFDEEAMESIDFGAKKRERDFLVLSINSQTEKLHDIECELASLSSVRARPAEIAQSISALDGKIDSLTEKFEAYMLAIESIEAASGKLRDAVSPKIAKTSSKLLSGLSGGKYRTVFMDSDFGMSYSDGGITRDVSSLSAGTSDIAYISLRLALIDTLCKEFMPPLVFDESFARLDSERLALALRLIDATLGKNAQAIIFTCHKREQELSKNVIKSNILSI
ncbi:MAG: hypothetical protein E7608_01650 [Ruminococcaceae bacterium]|nr:hypothetical protein [Oscillospiraceae bacterium]